MPLLESHLHAGRKVMVQGLIGMLVAMVGNGVATDAGILVPAFFQAKLCGKPPFAMRRTRVSRYGGASRLARLSCQERKRGTNHVRRAI